MAYYLGIDIGSGYSKAAIFDGNNTLSFSVIPSGGNYKEAARAVSEAAVEKSGISFNEISATVATGYGASAAGFPDRSATDISCHAAGIHHLFPSVRTFIDIGAQFSRAVRINEDGKVTSFVLNEKCAGGSGKFLQVIARILHISLDEIGPLSLKSTMPVQFTTGCAVFAESEAVSRIAEGALPADILAGIHSAMSSKIVNLVTRIGLEGDCAVTGGGAKDTGLVKTIEKDLEVRVVRADEPQISAALGAAIMAHHMTMSS